jgi:NAD(P)H-binding
MSVVAPVRRRQTVLVAATLVCAASMLVLGAWAFLAPESFSRFIDYAPYNRHLIHDAGAFQLGIGVSLLAALWWTDGLLVALTGFAVASGAIGTPLTRQLVAHDHQVLGLTRDWDGARRLQALGATPVVADALDRDGLLRAVDGLAADAVIHELTALRKPPPRHRGMALTNRLRTEGTTNLLAAAEALGARRFLTQSVIFGYGYRDHGPRLLTEEDPFGLPAGDACDPHVAAMRSTEQQAFTAPEGIAVRGRHLDARLQRQGHGRARLAALYPNYRAGVHAMAAATKEEPCRSPGRSDAGTRSA